MFRAIQVLAASLLAAVLLDGCLATINAVTAPTSVTAGENFAVAVDGSISGPLPGAAALVVQLPDSISFVRAMYITSTAKRRLRPLAAAAEMFTAEYGHHIVALADSAQYSREKADDVRVVLTLRGEQTGMYTLKFAATAIDESGRWRSTDPGGLRDFIKHTAPDKAATLSVIDAERNGTTALSFSGGREYIAFPDTGLFAFTLESDFACEFWIMSTARDAAILSTRGDDVLGAFPLEIAIDERGSLALSACDGSALYRTRSAVFIADGSWHHIAAVYTAARRSYELYVDAKFVESLLLPDSALGRLHEAPVMGGRPSKKKWLHGEIDELRFWSATRTQDEVIFYKNTALSGYEKNLYALYGFEQTQNGRIASTTAVENIDAVAYNKPKLVPSTAPLRVELISFSVLQEGSDVTMSWESYDESKVKSYHVEKRTEEGKYTALISFESNTGEGNHHAYRASDTWSEKSVVYYRLKKMNLDGSVVFSDEVPVGAGEIMNFTLGDNAPNPFSTVTEIPYTLSETASITLRVYDLTGREVGELVNERQKPGSYSVSFDGSNLPPGPYFYKLRSSAGAQTKKMFLNR